MRRREFIGLLGATAVCSAAAQAEGNRIPLISVVINLPLDDSEVRARLEVFRQSLQASGWEIGRTVRVEYRSWVGDVDHIRRSAAELIGLGPDLIFATGSPTLEPLLQATHTVPIVFVQVADPVGAGLVESLSHPGGNATGFTAADYDVTGKWLQLLKEIAPSVSRVAILRDSNVAAGIGQWAASQAFATSFGLDLHPINVSAASEIERSVDVFARDRDSGMIVTLSAPSIGHRELIINLAARYHLPTIYPLRVFTATGGLISYGSNTADSYRRAASYVDRILRGAKPSDLPVQNPTKFDLVINLKAAKQLGITVPQSLLARADEVIE